MLASDDLYEIMDSCLDHRSLRIRESVKDEYICIHISQSLSKIRLELAAAAATETQDLISCQTGQLSRICHA